MDRETKFTMFAATLKPIEQYRNVGTVTSVSQADPHELVTLLYDGALAAVLQGRHAIESGDRETKIATLSKAMRIIDEGLKAAVESHGDTSLADNLRSLYDHMVGRLLQANVHNDAAPLGEIARLLGELRSAWVQIAPDRPAGADLQA
jgi:flagellar secretion chaperone FliS